MNLSTCACKCDKDFDIGEYLKDFTCMKSLFDDLAVTCDEIEDTQESVVVNTSKRINYWLIVVVLFAIACLLSLVTIVVKYCMKRGLTIPFLLSYLCREQ